MKNLAILIGNLGGDVETRYSQSGTCIANFNLATTEKVKRNDEWTDDTQWHRIVAFGRLGEICGEYLSKGSKVYIEGRIQTRQWDDKEGNKRYTTEVVAREMRILNPKSQGAESQAPPMGDDVPF